MKPGKEKEKLEKSLRTSPLFETKHKQGLQTAMEVPPQPNSAIEKKGKNILENNPKEASSSFRKREVQNQVIKCATEPRVHATANRPVTIEKTPLSGNPIQNNNPNTPTPLKIMTKTTPTAISIPLHTPFPLTDRAIGLIKSLPGPKSIIGRTPTTCLNPSPTNIQNPNLSPTTCLNPSPTDILNPNPNPNPISDP